MGLTAASSLFWLGRESCKSGGKFRMKNVFQLCSFEVHCPLVVIWKVFAGKARSMHGTHRVHTHSTGTYRIQTQLAFVQISHEWTVVPWRASHPLKEGRWPSISSKERTRSPAENQPKEQPWEKTELDLLHQLLEKFGGVSMPGGKHGPTGRAWTGKKAVRCLKRKMLLHPSGVRGRSPGEVGYKNCPTAWCGLMGSELMVLYHSK